MLSASGRTKMLTAAAINATNLTVGVALLLASLSAGGTGCTGSKTTTCLAEPSSANCSHTDGGADSTGADAGVSCSPVGGATNCPLDQRYCCGTPDVLPFHCSSQYTPPTSSFECEEQPIGGMASACDYQTGSGCPAAEPICCETPAPDLGLERYCTDHHYEGPGWHCSQ